MKYTAYAKYALLFGIAFGLYTESGFFSMAGFLFLWLTIEWRKQRPKRTYYYYPMPPGGSGRPIRRMVQAQSISSS